jgi:phosphodiesterase/alkaline phosphatase D-like protein
VLIKDSQSFGFGVITGDPDFSDLLFWSRLTWNA